MTDGQATSAILSSDHWLKNSELLIYNIDTYVEPDVLTPQSIQQGSDGWVPCFQAAGDHWSFLNPDKDGWAIEVAEKKSQRKSASLIMHRLDYIGSAQAKNIFQPIISIFLIPIIL